MDTYLFIRNPDPDAGEYNFENLTPWEELVLSGLLQGAGVYCPFGFEPVNLNTGNFYMSQADALLTELGGDFEVQRAYNSLLPDNRSEFGRGVERLLWRTFNHASGWKNIVPPERWRDAAIYQGRRYLQRAGGV